MNLKDDTDFFIGIQGWMIKKLGLKGNELIVYALIHGFSQDGRSYYYGSTKYLMESTNLSKETVLTVLQNLVAKKLVVKKDVKSFNHFDTTKTAQGNQHFCLYYTAISRASAGQETVPANESGIRGSRNLTGNETRGSENLTRAGQESVPAPVKNFDLIINSDNKAGKKAASSCEAEKDLNQKSTEAENLISEKLKALFNGHLVFDSEFVPKIAELCRQFELKDEYVSDYLQFVFERTQEKKPNSLTNMFYKMAQSAAVMNDFLIEKQKTESKSNQNVAVCPVCKTENVSVYDCCPKCGFEMAHRNDEKEVVLKKQIFELPESKKQKFKAEYEAELKRQFDTGMSNVLLHPKLQRDFRERISEIYRKYGITA